MTGTIGEPQVVDAGRGAAWWGEGFRLFTSSFWTWIGIMVIYIIISMLINVVPYVGTLGHWLPRRAVDGDLDAKLPRVPDGRWRRG